MLPFAAVSLPSQAALLSGAVLLLVLVVATLHR